MFNSSRALMMVGMSLGLLSIPFEATWLGVIGFTTFIAGWVMRMGS